MKKRTFYRTVITLEVLSEEPYNPTTLDEIEYDITEGHHSGVWQIVESFEIDGYHAAKALLNQGSDPEFFSLDENGNDIEI